MSLTPERAVVLDWMTSSECYYSPLYFAKTAYAWGESDLKHHPGPRKWQQEVMLGIEKYLRDGMGLQKALNILPDYYRHAVASGRGPGKSALIGMLAHWFLSTRIGGSTWVAANGKPQLETKTFPEIAKWVMRGENRDFFEMNSTTIRPSKWFGEFIESPEGLNKSTRYYYISGQLWSRENPDAFAGAHNYDGEFAVFDEASGIPDEIWPVQEGVFTENIIDRFWLAFSNPRVSTGAFYECFHKNRDRWITSQIDSRSVEGISHSAFDAIIAEFGEDSDEAKVEVYGQFPSVGDSQFIGGKLVDEAIARPRYDDPFAPTVLGVDIARFGSDSTVLVVRKGRDLVSIRKFKGLDTMQVVGRVIEAIDKYAPDLTVLDEGGLGAGVLDRLHEQRYKVRGVNFGSRADTAAYANKRAEMWGSMKEWLKTASIGSQDKNAQAANRDLKTDLCAPQYKLNSNGAILLESKADIKKRGGASPDAGDSVAVTFAYPVANKAVNALKKDSKKCNSRRTGSKSAAGAWMS